MKTLRDRFWLWGQNPGSHHYCGDNAFKLPGVNRMDAAEGGRHFGIPNCCRVAMTLGPEPPFDDESALLGDFKQVVWSAVGAGGVTRNNNDQSDLDEVLRQAERHSNVTGAVLDDFFVGNPESSGQEMGLARHSIKSTDEMRRRLHAFPGRKLDLWVVWYRHQFDLPVADYIDLCDVVTFWFWKGSELADLDTILPELVAKSPGKRRMVGCYLWNYGERKPMTREQMQHQFDTYLSWIRSGDIEGIIFCSNCVADIGLEAADMARDWIAKVGDQPDPFATMKT